MAENVPTQVDVVIIGAGLCGLTAAHTLAQSGRNLAVIEASDTPGGVIRSVSEEGYLVEAGPTTFQSTGQALIGLCQTLNLLPVSATPAAKKRYLFLKGRLTPLPMNPIQFITSPVLSWQGKARLVQEPWIPPHPGNQQESVAAFVRRRLGPEVLENLVGPFLSGVYAGDPEALSVSATFPRLTEWEESAGSIVRGAIRARKQSKKAGPPKAPYALMSFSGGMAALPQRLAETLPPGSLRLSTRVQALEKTNKGFLLKLSTGESLEAQAVVLATPAQAAASLLEPLSSDLTTPLRNIPYAPIAVVHFGFERQNIPHPLDGFGFLVPRTQKLPLLGSIWGSSLFSNRAPAGHVLFSSFIGGALQPEVAQWSDEQIAEQVLSDLRQVFQAPGLTTSYRRVFRYPAAIPQYELGHNARLKAMAEALTQQLPGVFLTGNYLKGVSLNDCVLQGQQAAQAAEAYLRIDLG
jgi:oxygen-dependent protoporphyrinogen oxidase